MVSIVCSNLEHIHFIEWILYFYFLANKPEKSILLRFLSSVNAKWQEIGDLLGVDSNTVEGLCHSNYSDQVKMSKMLQSWLDNEHTPATWGNIISILDGPLQKKSLAIEICQFLDNEPGMSLNYYCNNNYTCLYMYM